MSTNIDIELFKYQWAQIEALVNEVAAMPKIWTPLGRYKHSRIAVEDDGITYEEYDGDGDSDSFTIRWDELNNHPDYFREKFKKEIDDREMLKKKVKEQEEEKAQGKRREEYERLKREFES